MALVLVLVLIHGMVGDDGIKLACVAERCTIKKRKLGAIRSGVCFGFLSSRILAEPECRVGICSAETPN
jgi:hypothetical protein